MILNDETFRNYLVFSSAYSLIMWLMRSPKNFEKIAILKLNLPLKYWFMEAKNDFCVCHGPQKWSKYHLDTLQTTLSENNNY